MLSQRPLARPFARSVSLAALMLGLLITASAMDRAQAQATSTAPRLTEALGRVELLTETSVWRAQNGPGGIPEITRGLRTGAGRAVITGAAGTQVLVGSASRLRRYQNEVDLLEGQFLLTGPVAAHALGRHVVLSGGRARVDLQDAAPRVAVLSGSARVAVVGGPVTVKARQQLNLSTGKLSEFRETDPWYAAQFTGEGVASLEALRGPVDLTSSAGTRRAVRGDELRAGYRLNTGTGAWAEVGFTGGGYLRLNEQSELTVLSVDRTTAGREVRLNLTKGTAWNVVEKRQGGYRIDTPVVSTAVRGTTFRVDASGTVKVMEGTVALPGQAGALPGQGDAALTPGQQRNADGTLAPLHMDALDQFNRARDAERAQSLTLGTDPGAGQWPRMAAHTGLTVSSLPDARVTLDLTPVPGGSPQTLAPRTLELAAREGEGTYRPDPWATSELPEGTYRVTVTAQRFGQTRTLRRLLTVDRTAPEITGLRLTRQGRLLLLEGEVRDSAARPISLSLPGISGTRSIPPGPFRWLLPAPPAGPLPTALHAQDEAGNEAHVPLP